MIEDFTTTIKAQLYERVSSPLLSSFIVSWCGWNYKFLLVIFSSIPMHEKLVYIDLNIFPDVGSRVVYGALLPLLTSLFLIFVYPVPAEFIYKHVKINQRRLKEIQQSIDDESPLSKEQARKIRREALENQLKYESEIDSKTSENSRLKELISELQQSQIKSAGALTPVEVAADSEKNPPSGLEHQSGSIESVVLPDLSRLASDQLADINFKDFNRARTESDIAMRIDSFMRESVFEYVSGLSVFSDVDFNVTAKNGELAILFRGRNGAYIPYITAEYTPATMDSVLESIKSALEHDRPDFIEEFTKQSDLRTPLRKDSLAVKKLILDGFATGKGMIEIRNEVLGAGVSERMFNKVLSEIIEAGERATTR